MAMPFEQGGLDSLCGIYSIVNAERIINKTKDSQDFFNSIIDYVGDDLGSFVKNGMLYKDLKNILKNVCASKIKIEDHPSFIGKSNPGLDDFWSSMYDFLNGSTNDSKQKRTNRAIILGISGKHNHWTVIKSITEKKIFLQDSNQLHYFNRSTCTTKYESGKRQHVLWPAQAIFLTKCS